MQSRTSTRGNSGYTNNFSSSFEDNELYFLPCGVSAKPGIAKDLIEADGIGRKAIAYELTHFKLKPVFHNSIKCYKLIKF